MIAHTEPSRASLANHDVSDHGVEYAGRDLGWVIQLSSGVFPLNRHDTASTSTHSAPRKLHGYKN